MVGTPNNCVFLTQRRYNESPEDGICKRDEFQRDRIELCIRERSDV